MIANNIKAAFEAAGIVTLCVTPVALESWQRWKSRRDDKAIAEGFRDAIRAARGDAADARPSSEAPNPT